MFILWIDPKLKSRGLLGKILEVSFYCSSSLFLPVLTYAHSFPRQYFAASENARGISIKTWKNNAWLYILFIDAARYFIGDTGGRTIVESCFAHSSNLISGSGSINIQLKHELPIKDSSLL